MSTEIVKSVSVENLLAQRAAMIARMQQVYDLLQETDAIGTACGIVSDDHHRSLPAIIGTSRGAYCHELALYTKDHLAAATKRLDAAAWAHLMQESGLLTFMDANARKAWNEKIERCDVPPLTRENIEATFVTLHDSRGDLFDRGVIECFRTLSWCYKTNLPHRFGKRIHTRVRNGGYVDHRCTDRLEDLNRVFSVMDGKPEDDARHGLYQRLYASERTADSRRLDRFEHEDTYMHFRVFKNGMAHITFRRPDLVRSLNGILARHYPNALPERIA